MTQNTVGRGLLLATLVAASTARAESALEEVQVVGQIDTLELDAAQQSLASTGSWDCFDAPVLEQEWGKRVLLHLSVTNLSSPNVQIDDLLLRFSLFSDGFESGDLSAWSTTVP